MSARRGAFDPARLDDDVEALLGPPPMSLLPTPAVEPPRQLAAVDASQPVAPARRGRGTGGRPTAARRQSEAKSPRPPRPAAVRIPRDLYLAVVQQLLNGMERPSYGQVVSWACEDYPDEVIAALPTPSPEARVPRGRRLATESVQVTLRGARELPVIDDLAAEAGSTRTAITIAALTVALRHAATGDDGRPPR